jgi:hypothetical protein
VASCSGNLGVLVHYAPYIVTFLIGLAFSVAGAATLGIGAVYAGLLVALLGAILGYVEHDRRVRPRPR